jgi:cytochrome P450 / NADPH-cytochrome P450 reductase
VPSFSKKINRVLNEVRNGVGDGLFTAHPGEHGWGVAHRILIPAFGPLSIRSMFDDMHDIASQLVMKWARAGPEEPIHVTDDFTRLALDTLALCTMDYRFNSYYKSEMHQFISAMGDFLTESGRRAQRPALANSLFRSSQQKYDADIAILNKTAEDLVLNRRAHPSDRKDLLNAMINGVDPKTGEKMSTQLIAKNMVTFLIAGHETTSGLLSFAFYFLLKNPEAFHRAQKEVDEVVGRNNPVTVEHLSKFPYLNAILRETLRAVPTIPQINVQPLEDTLLGGKYEVKKGETININLDGLHKDPAVYGEDANQWKPERMLDENFKQLPPDSWKPFGNGVRACIGRPFAWQEALLMTALLLQNFNFYMDDPSYELEIKQTLTIKPHGFFMRATLRDGVTATKLDRILAGSSDQSVTERQKSHPDGKMSAVQSASTRPMSIFFGSNTGTCEAFAQRLGSAAASHGFQADVRPLDSAKENLKPDRPNIIIAASYEGEPTDNAQHFVTWLKNLQGKEADGVPFAVFGCGKYTRIRFLLAATKPP